MAVTCRVLGISRQAYYQWESDPVSQRDWDDAHLIKAALEIHTDDPTEGYRFIADELARRGFAASENRVWRICSMQKIFSLHAKKKARNPKAGPPVHDDLVDRDFTATAPNTKWLTDITEHSTAEGKLYLCAVKDCYSNRIVGYSIGPRMRSSGRVGACGDNAAMESSAGRDRAFGQGQSISLFLATEEHSQHQTLEESGGTTAGDRVLDRDQIPPPATATPPRQTHPSRV